MSVTSWPHRADSLSPCRVATRGAGKFRRMVFRLATGLSSGVTNFHAPKALAGSGSVDEAEYLHSRVAGEPLSFHLNL